jgi:hypothetical protein
LLAEAERRFGPRDKSWTILGVDFGGSSPNIWYPSSGDKMVVVKLSDNASLDPNRALFQLSHEVIHLLSPSGGKMAPALEEGPATHFSE